jgi:putative ABC transport system ATP-binding protein
VAVARALVNEPLLLLADEPTGNLDIPTGEALHGLLERLVRERGQTTVVATHNPRLAERADAVYRMVDGGLVAEEAVGQDVPGSPTGVRETPGAASSGEGRERRP